MQIEHKDCRADAKRCTSPTSARSSRGCERGARARRSYANK